MSPDERPAVVAYDGSPEAQAAVRAAVTLFSGRRLAVVTVWEPGLALAMTAGPDMSGIGGVVPGAEEMIAIDRAQRDHAVEAAHEGARLARELGATVEPLAVAEEADVAETVAEIADGRDACVVVVGSRGLGRVRSLFGSTTRALLQRTDRPVLIVRAPR